MMQQTTVPLNQKEMQLLPKLQVTRFVGKASAMAAWNQHLHRVLALVMM